MHLAELTLYLRGRRVIRIVRALNLKWFWLLAGTAGNGAYNGIFQGSRLDSEQLLLACTPSKGTSNHTKTTQNVHSGAEGARTSQVGVVKGRALSARYGLPLVKVHHMEAHALVSRLHTPVPFPFLCLLVSGGHNLLLLAEGVGKYTLLGTTLDDAMGTPLMLICCVRIQTLLYHQGIWYTISIKLSDCCLS